MTIDLISLALIALVAAACPLLAQAIPGKPIPETVFLLLAGAVLGPHLIGVIQLTEAVGLLSDLGLAFLFLLAGYEISPKNLTSSQGKRGLITWAVSLALAFLVVRLSQNFSINQADGIAMTIALTTTALGTLMPIMKERGLMGTRVGDSILAYGTWGELCPVIAMALLLSTRAEWKTILILLAFVAIAVLVAVVPKKARKAGNRLFKFLTQNANTTAQTMMRITVLLLVGLIALSAVFDLDIVLGAFAAGFVLRYVIPQGNTSLETKLEGVAYGFLIPIFFVSSGAKIDLGAVFQQPLLLVGFIVMLLLIRAVPIFVALSTGKDTRDISTHNRLTISLYCTTALPIIVAVTSVAVTAGAMAQETASVLVAAGAVTVFLMPLLGQVTYRVVDAKPLEAVREIRQNPHDIGAILRDHMTLERLLARQEAAARLTARQRERASAILARHLPSRADIMESWLPINQTEQALSVMNATDFDKAAWERAKREGDAAWERAKVEGDAHWEQLKEQAEARWVEIKRTGDEVAAMPWQNRSDIPWQERAALLQEHTEHAREIDEQRDSEAQKLAAKTTSTAEHREEHRRHIAERAEREQIRRLLELTRHSEHPADKTKDQRP